MIIPISSTKLRRRCPHSSGPLLASHVAPEHTEALAQCNMSTRILVLILRFMVMDGLGVLWRYGYATVDVFVVSDEYSCCIMQYLFVKHDIITC